MQNVQYSFMYYSIQFCNIGFKLDEIEKTNHKNEHYLVSVLSIFAQQKKSVINNNKIKRYDRNLTTLNSNLFNKQKSNKNGNSCIRNFKGQSNY